MRLHCLQHAAFETPGSMMEWAASYGYSWSYTHLHEPEPRFPALADFDWLVMLGGAMGVHEEGQYPWLKPEKQFIRAAIAAGKVVLGICMGAQLLADALGARVYRNKALEIGFWPLQPSPAAATSPLFSHLSTPLTVLHWHGDTFDLPPGAAHLASSAACELQAFSVADRLVGLQFHPELTPAILLDMLHHDGHELEPGPWVQPAPDLRWRVTELAAGRVFLFQLLDQLASIHSAPQ
ncbi:type 1 glutamine amidotransferase [Hymenobacter metallicola]|uniref:Type 1 glutamine amidotransferase n=1 Tax=Hymenobacter metallicola TaxID=2563114 RepID=A0A4Z0QJ86_9BACT|nr:type 1 glutamine amidotransferase [Hymenobacter metallicola]TGE29061.1 type 1 glutamine amidotransferase [Hymenobacter metallicola]